jgi:hypothetical protein
MQKLKERTEDQACFNTEADARLQAFIFGLLLVASFSFDAFGYVTILLMVFNELGQAVHLSQ